MRLFVALVAIFLMTSCSGRVPPNFSQYPGFPEYYEANPRRTTLPTTEEIELLVRYQPRLFVGEGQEGPIDFYRDYIAHGSITAEGMDRLTVPDGLTPAERNRFLVTALRDETTAVFKHAPSNEEPHPAGYGRVDYDDVPEIGRVTFLTWHFPFRASGLPEGLSSVAWFAANVVADARDWHQLDHYTATTLALDARGKPFAVLLQHHNYMRTYIIGREIELPADDRIRIAAGLSSNELYPYRRGRRVWRAAGFLSEDTAPYIVNGEQQPWLSADDITDPSREVEYGLQYLTPDDPFYAFAGYLGARRLLPGRDGPPGADYNTLPQLKPLAVQLVLFNWRPGDLNDMHRRLSLVQNVDEAKLNGFAVQLAMRTACARGTELCVASGQ